MECVLFVDDDVKICDITARYIRDIPLDVVCAFNGEEAAVVLETRNISLVILDVMLPDASGFDFLADFRAGTFYRSAASAAVDTPVIMLTALSQNSNIVKGLRAGADDYIVKPYDPMELVERIKAVLKRSGRFINEEFAIGNVRVDLTAQKFYCGSHNFELQRREKDLFLYMARNNHQRIFPREELISQVWGFDYDGSDRAVDICVQRLRSKLKEIRSSVSIKTVWGQGYRLEVKQNDRE